MTPPHNGIIYLNAEQPGGPTPFPRELRRKPWGWLDARYGIILLVCAVVMGGVTIVFSMRKPSVEATEQEILKIQERYAQLVLNQPLPQEKPEEQGRQGATSSTQEQTPQSTATEQQSQDVDRQHESVAQQQQRKAATAQQRQQQRQKIQKQIASSGIFAAITASGGGSSGRNSVSDVLGAANGVGDLASLPASQGRFATKKSDDLALAPARGNRTSGVGIEQQSVGRTEVEQIASVTDVKVSSEPADFKGDEGAVSTSKGCINQVIRHQQSRLKRVFETWLKRDPQLSGRIKVKFTLLPSGSVTAASLVQSTMNNARFEETIVRYIRQWDFSSCEIGAPIDIELPFVFEGGQ
jgi:TonB family protein